jgi:hypothetical protein
LAARTSALFACDFAGFEIAMMSVNPIFDNEDIQHKPTQQLADEWVLARKPKQLGACAKN